MASYINTERGLVKVADRKWVLLEVTQEDVDKAISEINITNRSPVLVAIHRQVELPLHTWINSKKLSKQYENWKKNKKFIPGRFKISIAIP